MPLTHHHKDLDWNIVQLEVEILERIQNENLEAVSGTWFIEKDYTRLNDWVNQQPNRYALFATAMDPLDNLCLEWIPGPQRIPWLSDRIHKLKSSDICIWLIQTERKFARYSIEELTPKSFNNKFLCYQRKPHDYRVKLFELLKNKHGLVTLSGHDFTSINVNIPDVDVMLNDNEHALGMMPCDIFSLGNMEVWNNSFLNIVAETDQMLSNDDAFLSEKSFKPIIGLRPFINYLPYASKVLQDRGFEVFDDDFGYEPFKNIDRLLEHIVEVVDNMPPPYEMWIKLYPKIKHNYEHFKVAALAEWNRIDMIADKYRKLTEL